MQKWFIYSLLFIIVLFVLFEYNLKENKPLCLESFITDSAIPLNLYQTWFTKDLPTHMKKNVNELRKQNPEFKYYLYDDEDCRDFISKNFEESVVDAYDKLVPGAYKADLWRYCILYINGGIYLDMKMRCIGDFKLIELTKKEHYVKDIFAFDGYPNENTLGIYNAVMIQKKKNPFLMECIKQIVKNVNDNYYGFSPLYPTGPGLLGEMYMKYRNNYRLEDVDMYHVLDGEKIIYKERAVLEHYPEYRKEQVITQRDAHYSVLWHNQSIYIMG
jgi:mannosyltransferase OCH1-like enzyme